MKTIILALIAAATISRAAILADGSGFFPILVQVIDPISGTPIAGAEVHLGDLSEYTEIELDPDRQIKVLPETPGKTITTNAEGVAVVFYHGRFSTTTINGKTSHSRSMAATIIVEQNGKEIYRSTLADWAKANGFVADESSVPWVIVSPPDPKQSKPDKAEVAAPNLLPD